MTHTRALLLAAAMLAPLPASATTFYRADVTQVNNTGVSGFVTFELSDDTSSLRVDVELTGLDDGVHFLHIHGKDAGTFPGTGPVDTTPPPPPVPPNGDADSNGVLTTGEAKAGVGNVILSLATHPSGVSGELNGIQSTGGKTATFSFINTYNLNDTGIFEPGYTKADLLPLDFRVFDLHGAIIPEGAPTDGTVTAPGTFDSNLPIGAGAIALADATGAVPEPATWAMMIGGFGLVGGAARRRRTSVRYA